MSVAQSWTTCSCPANSPSLFFMIPRGSILGIKAKQNETGSAPSCQHILEKTSSLKVFKISLMSPLGEWGRGVFPLKHQRQFSLSVCLHSDVWQPVVRAVFLIRWYIWGGSRCIAPANCPPAIGGEDVRARPEKSCDLPPHSSSMQGTC